MSPNSAVSIILTPLYEFGNLSVSVSTASLLYFIHSVKRTDINFTSARTTIGIKESISICSHSYFVVWLCSLSQKLEEQMQKNLCIIYKTNEKTSMTKKCGIKLETA